MDDGLELLDRAGFRPFAEPNGGMFVWAARPDLDPVELARDAAGHGIVLAPGNLFRPQLQATSYLRFNAAYLGDPRIDRFLKAI